MTESDYRDPLIEIMDTLCFNYSKKLYHELAKLQKNIQDITDILDDCDDSVKMNSYFQKFQHYAKRIEEKRLSSLEFISHFDEHIFQIMAIMKKPQPDHHMKIYYHDSLNYENSNIHITIYSIFQEFIFDKRNLIAVLKIHCFLLKKLGAKVGFQNYDNLFLILEDIQESVEIIRSISHNFSEDLRYFRAVLNQAIRIYN